MIGIGINIWTALMMPVVDPPADGEIIDDAGTGDPIVDDSQAGDPTITDS